MLPLVEGLLLGGGRGVPGQRAPWRSAVHASPSQRRMVGSWRHVTQIQKVRGTQKANSHCGGHTLWATLSHSCSQPMTRPHLREEEQRGRTDLPTLQCPARSSAFCQLLGQALSVPRRTFGRLPRTWGFSSPPSSPLLSSLQTLTQRFSHLSTRPGPDAEPPSRGRGRSSKQACLYLI